GSFGPVLAQLQIRIGPTKFYYFKIHTWKIEGKYKVSYSDGKEPAWFPAEFIIYGNMLIMKPISLNAPVVMSFYIKQR
ncbi:MAG: hypothetical protein ABW100_20645, partial [Candidatus Thiodiazotropha sp. 6PLUC3]